MNFSFLWLSLALFTWGTGEGMFYMFQPFYLSQLGANPVMTGYILGAMGFAMVIAHIPAGYLSDRIGTRPLLITAWLFGVAATWFMALANSLPLFIAGLLLYGFTAYVSSPLTSYITNARGNWSVGRALTVISSTFNFGMVLGPFLGGLIGEHYGLRAVYYVAGVLFIISTIFIFFIAPQAPKSTHEGKTSESLLGNKRYLSFIALGFLVCFAMYLPQQFTPKFLHDVRGLSLESIGSLGTIGGLGNTVLLFVLGSFDARLGFLLGQVSVGFFNGILWKMQGYGWYAVAYFLLGGFRAGRSLYSAQIRPLVHEAQIGLAYGISEAVLGLTGIIAPVAAGFLYQHDKTLMYPLALFAITVCFFITLGFPYQKAQENPIHLQSEVE